MSKLDEYRKQIELIDEKLFALLKDRMNLSRNIGLFKWQNQMPVEDKNREAKLFSRLYGKPYEKELLDIYHTVIENSRSLQNYDYFLVGKSLNYSFSPKIYEALGLSGYNLCQRETLFSLHEMPFRGINVTNPFKEAAYRQCDFLSEEALSTQAVNTVIRKDGKLFGYNTDFYGFSYLLDHFGIDARGKNVLILGNGATSRTIHQVLTKRLAKNIVHLVRILRNDKEFPLSEYQNFADYDILINATPYGTYPENKSEPLFSLQGFRNLQAAIDVIYNPAVSPMLTEAKKHGIRTINGLYMLVSQGARSYSLFSDTDKTDRIDSVYWTLKRMLANISIIGMPYSGKTNLGKELGMLLSREVVDTDTALFEEGHDLSQVLTSGKQVADFRRYEAEKTVWFSHEWGKIISTGGGIVLQDSVMEELKKNGIILFLDTPLSTLISRIDDTRPLAKTEAELKTLYSERIPLYKKYADVTVKNENPEEIAKKINEYLDTQWSES